LLRAFPYFGDVLVAWVWGGFAVDNATLTRFFALHFLLPFVLTAVCFVHIFYLHTTGSNNPLGLISNADKIAFINYYTTKDAFGFIVFTSCLLIFVFFYPDYFLECSNFIPANALVTPAHIVPEWYFLFAYAILRCIPSKFGGVLALLVSILILGTLPFTHFQAIKGLCFYGPVKSLFWGFVTTFILLTLSGSWPTVPPYSFLTIVLSCCYFSFYFVLGVSCLFWD